MHLRQASFESFVALEMENESIALTLLPELGGKLISLRDLRAGHEWLWRSTRLPLARHTHGASYIEVADTGGWDECFPTVAPCVYPLSPYRGRALPDHGDVWSQPWATEVQQSREQLLIASTCRSVTLPCTFSRRLRLRGAAPTLEMAYEVHNQGRDAVAFIWSAHPLFALSAGMRLQVPPDARFNVYSTTPTSALPDGRGLQWPFTVHSDGHAVALDPLPGPDAGIAFKIWSDPLSAGWATLDAPRAALHLRFDVSEVPQLAVWLNAGGWSGIGGAPYYNLALEPCIGAQDSLAEAVLKYDRYVLLAAGELRRWNLQIELQAKSRPE